jgi:hypothetical protein
MNHRWLVPCGVLLLVACVAAVSSAQAVDLSGKWKLNAGKSDYHQVAPMLPDTTLDIVQDAGTLTIRTLMSLDGRNHATEVKFTTDKKECLNAGETIKDLKGTCWIDNGKVRIRTEAEGAAAEGAPGAGAPNVTAFRYMTERVYTLSADGKVLTSLQTLETPQGALTMTLVFDRVAPRSADPGSTRF